MTAKSDDGIGALSSLLQRTEVAQHNVVSFKGKALKLDKAEDADCIVKAIQSASDLQVLELSGNTLGTDAAKEIAKVLENRPELERCLWADMFTGRLRKEIPPSLIAFGDAIIKAKAHLVEIDLSDNAFGPIGIESIQNLLMDEACFSLEVLKFNNNGMGVGGVTLSKALIECHKRSTAAGKPLALKVFIAGRNRLEDPGAIALAEAFKTIGTLEEIHIPQNGINHGGVTALAEAVKNCPNLRHLNLNDNTFTEKGSISMAEAIKSVNNLEIINFGDCLVRTDGAIHIGDALKSSNPNLEQLLLSNCEIKLDGGIRVCEGVAGKERLALVDLNGNEFGADGVEEIIDMMKESNLSEALGSLSDDEGDSDGDEEDESDEEQEDEEVTNGFYVNETVDTNISAEDIPEKVSAGSLLALEMTRRQELIQQAVLRVGNDPNGLVDDCAKLSGLLVTSNVPDKEKLENVVCECADAYLRAAFRLCEEKPIIAINRLLVRTGLIKSEDKTVKAVANPRPLLQVLNHALRQPYFPRSTMKVVRAMVSKSSKIWVKSYDVQSEILKFLY